MLVALLLVIRLLQTIELFPSPYSTGLYKALPVRPNPRQRTLLAIFRSHLVAFHVEKDQGQTLFTLAPPSATMDDDAFVETTQLSSLFDPADGEPTTQLVTEEDLMPGAGVQE